jgi:hypothetical protein
MHDKVKRRLDSVNVCYHSTLILCKSLRAEIYAYRITLFLLHCVGVKVGLPLKEEKVD